MLSSLVVSQRGSSHSPGELFASIDLKFLPQKTQVGRPGIFSLYHTPGHATVLGLGMPDALQWPPPLYKHAGWLDHMSYNLLLHSYSSASSTKCPMNPKRQT